MRVLPDRLRVIAAWHLYRNRRSRWLELYDDAPLRFAPHIHMQLVPGDVISDHIAFSGIWELRLSRQVLSRARAGGTMIEIGANLGYFSLLWAASRKGNRSFAFEASPRAVPLLRANVARNSLETAIEVFAVAAGRETGHSSFDLGPSDQLGWGGLAASSAPDTATVEVVRVDEVLDIADEIAFLKVDVEGADTWALMGCERLFRERRVKEVWFEQNKTRMRALGIRVGEAAEYLESMGFAVQPQGNPADDLVEWSARLRNAAD